MSEVSEVERFIEECCVKDPDSNTARSILYAAYQAWGGIHPLRQFARIMRLAGFPSRRAKHIITYAGIRLKISELDA